MTQAEIDAFYLLLLEEMTKAFSLPYWAESKLRGEWVQFAQLQTRDGRRMGNAVILAVETVEWDGQPVELHTIITDFGNVLKLTERELMGQFTHL